MPTSPDLGLPFIAESQGQPNVTHNEAILALQILLNGVDDRAINTPPGSPANGDSYIVGAAPTGAWTGRANAIAYYLAGWRFIPGEDSDGNAIAIGAAHEGLRVYVRDENATYTWSGSAWTLGGDGAFVLRAGDTMTGQLLFDLTTQFGIIMNRNDDGNTGPGFAMRHTSASPAASDVVSALLFQGQDDAAAFKNAAGFSAIADNVTASGYSGRFQFNTSQAASYASRMQIAGGVWIGSASGTDRGSGTLNAARLYDDGIALNSQTTVATDAAFSLQINTSNLYIRHTGTLTADRTVTLSTTNALAGDKFTITRTGGGAFNLDVGGLKNLATGQWCEVCYDGSAWYLSKFGSL